MTVPGRAKSVRRNQRSASQMIIAGLVVLAVIASLFLIFSESVQLLRVGLVIALWAATLGAIAMTKYRRESALDKAKVRDLQTVYELQLEREIALAASTSWASRVGFVENWAPRPRTRRVARRTGGAAQEPRGPVRRDACPKRVALRAESMRVQELASVRPSAGGVGPVRAGRRRGTTPRGRHRTGGVRVAVRRSGDRRNIGRFAEIDVESTRLRSRWCRSRPCASRDAGPAESEPVEPGQAGRAGSQPVEQVKPVERDKPVERVKPVEPVTPVEPSQRAKSPSRRRRRRERVSEEEPAPVPESRSGSRHRGRPRCGARRRAASGGRRRRAEDAGSGAHSNGLSVAEIMANMSWRIRGRRPHRRRAPTSSRSRESI